MKFEELKKTIVSDNECSFIRNNKKYLLYGWNQCDGYILTLEHNNEVLWQSEPKSRNNCIEEFEAYYSKL